jgi:hypothetical protein
MHSRTYYRRIASEMKHGMWVPINCIFLERQAGHGLLENDE